MSQRGRERGRLLSVLTAVILVVSACAVGPSHVPRITIDNPTEYPVRAEVSGDASDGWLLLATRIEAGTERDVREVLDAGRGWTFRFSYADVAEDVVVSRDQLSDADWRVTVPEELANELRRRDVAPLEAVDHANRR